MRRGGMRGRVRWWEAIPSAAAIINIAYWYSVEASNLVFPDTASYLKAATKIRLTLFGGFREPVYPALLAIPTRVFGHDETVARIFGCIFFLALVVVLQVIARRWWGPAWAVGAAAAVAASPFFGYFAVGGLRDQLAIIGVLVVGAAVTARPSTGAQWCWIALAVGLTAMTRWDTVVLTVPVVVLAVVLQRVAIRTAALMALIVLVVIAPWIGGNAIRYGNPMYSSDRTATASRNLEFYGEPGYPSRAEVEENAFTGPAITWREYMFDHHSVGELARRFVEAPARSGVGIAVSSVFYPDPPNRDLTWPDLGTIDGWKVVVGWVLLIAAAIGAYCMVRKGRWPFALLVLLATLVHFPLLVLARRGNYDFRVEMTVWPLMVLAIVELVRAVATRRRSEQPAVA